MKRLDILQKAAEIVSGDRDEKYGAPEYSFNRIAKYWTIYKGVSFTKTDVAAMMALLKIARMNFDKSNNDDWIDLAGYAACGGELSEE